MDLKTFLKKLDNAIIPEPLCSYDEYLDNMMFYEFPETKI